VFIRKAFYWWLFPSAVVLPVWLLIGWAAVCCSHRRKKVFDETMQIVLASQFCQFA